MVRRLDGITHALKSQTDISSAVLSVVDRVQVEITRLVGDFRGRVAFLVEFEEEEFTFRADVEAVAHRFCLIDDFLEDISRIALERGLVIRHVDRADQTAGLDIFVLSPRNDRPGVVIGMQIHVTFIDPDESVDGGPVKHDLVVQRLFKLRHRDGDVLHDTKQVGELKSDKFHVVLFCALQNLLFCELTHKILLLDITSIIKFDKKEEGAPIRIGTPSLFILAKSLHLQNGFVNSF